MSTEELKKLLDIFFEGDATPGEEKRIRQLFSSNDIPAEFIHLKSYFDHIGTDSGATMKADPFARIEAFEEEDNEEATIIPIRSKRKRRLWFAGAAASILIIVAVVFQMYRYVNKVEDVYSDPQVAYNQAKNALLFVSSKFNAGTDKLQSIDKVNDGVNSLQQVTKFEDGIEQSRKIERYNKIEKVIGTSN